MCDGHSDVLVDIGHKTISVDGCIADLVRVLNEGGFPTIASCCGHDDMPGNIVLADDRWLILTADRTEGEQAMAPFSARWLASRLSRLENEVAALHHARQQDKPERHDALQHDDCRECGTSWAGDEPDEPDDHARQQEET